MNPDPNQPQPIPPSPTVAPPAGLQFDKAEISGEPLLTCAACKTPITGEYYQVNGQNFCAKCRTNIESFAAGGSEITRFGRAVGAGIVAGFGGFLLYWVILELTHINFGLIAIVVGWMVGAAVRWGSNRMGGRFYQVLAVVITYVAICSTYIPLVLRGAPHPADEVFFAFIFAMKAPWLEGPSNIIGWIIIAFGLMQAWQMNRELKMNVSGPFFTRQSSPPAAT
jgi:hypothetical protein